MQTNSQKTIPFHQVVLDSKPRVDRSSVHDPFRAFTTESGIQTDGKKPTGVIVSHERPIVHAEPRYFLLIGGQKEQS